MIEQLPLAQSLSQSLVGIRVIREHNRRDRLRDELLADVEQRLGFSHTRQLDHHQVRVRSTRDLPLNSGITERVRPEHDASHWR